MFKQSEYEKYNIHKSRCVFKSPEEEHSWAMTQQKPCSKCNKTKKLIYFQFNTSGNDPFDKNGYRLRRPECIDCVKNNSYGVRNSKNKSKQIGFSTKPPEGAKCGICESSYNLVFDHCHKKEEFRGWLCNSCNRSLGIFGDDVTGLCKAINYLKHSEPDWETKVLSQLFS